MVYNLSRYITSLFGSSLEAADAGPAAVHPAGPESANSTLESPNPHNDSADKSLVKFEPGIRDKPHLRYIQLPASVEKNKWQVELEPASLFATLGQADLKFRWMKTFLHRYLEGEELDEATREMVACNIKLRFAIIVVFTSGGTPTEAKQQERLLVRLHDTVIAAPIHDFLFSEADVTEIATEVRGWKSEEDIFESFEAALPDSDELLAMRPHPQQRGEPTTRSTAGSNSNESTTGSGTIVRPSGQSESETYAEGSSRQSYPDSVMWRMLNRNEFFSFDLEPRR